MCPVSESYTGGQQKQLRSELAWLRLTVVTNVENKHINGEMLSFLHGPAGRHLNQDNMVHLHEFFFSWRDYSDKRIANNIASSC